MSLESAPPTGAAVVVRPASRAGWIGGGLVFLAALAAVVYLQTRPSFTVRADGRAQTVRAHAATVREVLSAAGLTVAAQDVVWLGNARVQSQVSDLNQPIEPASVVVLQRASLVRIDVDGRALEVRTQAVAPFQILAENGVLLYAADEVWADGVRADPAAPPETAPRRIVVRRAVTVSVVDDGASFTLQTAARTVGEALWDAGLRVHQADEVRPALATPLTSGVTITLTRARPVTVQVDGRSLMARSRAATVGEALAEIGLALVGADYTTPAVDQALPADGVIRVVRVREEVLTEQVLIPRETVYQALPDVEIDNVQTLQAGADGIQRRYVRVRYEDGVEVGRTTEAEVVAQAPTPRVIGYGAKIVVRTLETPDGVIEYWRAYTMYATSYSASRAGTPVTARNYGRTASGKLLTKGMVAIDRTMMPFGTRMYVPGYGFAVAEDTGGGVKGRFIDLGYDDWNYKSWHQVVTVYFLTPIPPASQIRWIIPPTVP